jgi:O-antigen ligase
MTMPLVFWLWVRDQKWSFRSALAVGFLGLLSGLFVMTLSRGAFIVFFSAVFMYLFFRKKFLAAAVGLPLLLLFTLSSDVTHKNFVSSVNPDDITIQERLNSWKLTAKMIRTRPVLGNGCGLYYERIGEWESNVARFRRYAQNSYLRLWSEVGLLGFVGFMAPLVILFYKASPFSNTRERYGWTHALYVGLLAFLFQSMFDANFYAFQTSILFWAFWALFVSMRAAPSPESLS